LADAGDDAGATGRLAVRIGSAVNSGRRSLKKPVFVITYG
jgi:hypothetical protein